MKNFNPLVSIIIPIYNRESLVGETLNSILTQTYQNWECILVDDHSTDKTWEVLSSYGAKDKRFGLYKRPSERPKGANACRNYGFELAKGTWIQWFDSDDLMDPLNLELRMEKARVAKKANLIVSIIAHFKGVGENLNKVKEVKNILTSHPQKDYYLYKVHWFTSNVTFHISLLNNPDIVFRENIHRSQERLFLSELLSIKKTVLVYIDKCIVLKREHHDSITGKFRRGGKKELKSAFLVNEKVYRLLPSELRNSTECFSFFWRSQIHIVKIAYQQKHNFLTFMMASKFFASLAFDPRHWPHILQKISDQLNKIKLLNSRHSSQP